MTLQMVSFQCNVMLFINLISSSTVDECSLLGTSDDLECGCQITAASQMGVCCEVAAGLHCPV